MLIICLIHAIYIVFYDSFFSLHCNHDILFFFTFYINLFKILHIFVILKEKLMPSLVLDSMGHVYFLLTKQVCTYPFYVYFLDLDRGVRPSLA